MRIHRVHTRELAAPAAHVAVVLDGLGGLNDRLFPTRRPATPLALDGPLEVGTHGRIGALRHVIEEYFSGRRLVFRFAPGQALSGTHRFEVESVGCSRSRLTHTLEARLEPKLIALGPRLVRRHDALLEDLLDRAELLTTGRIVHSPVYGLRPSRRRGRAGAPPTAREPTGRKATLPPVNPDAAYSLGVSGPRRRTR
jgi:hypothetical protein